MAVAENYAVTKMRVADATYMWTIQNFSYYSKHTGEKLYSPIFTLGDDADLKWRLDIFTMGIDNPKWISLYLHLRRSLYHSITAEFRFSILNKNDEVVYQLPWSQKYTFNECDMQGFREFIKRDDLFQNANTYLPEDKLTIFCKVRASIGYEVTKSSTSTSQLCQYNSEREVCNDFQWLYQTGQMSDITLLLKGMNFLGHRCILASRSSVFQEMFEQHSKIGNQLRLIDVREFENKIMMEVLRYIYTGKIKNLHALGTDILAAAVRYGLNGLKLTCEQYLIRHLSTNNAWDVLIVADKCKVVYLKHHVKKFIVSHANDTINTTGYYLTQKSYPHLVTEILNSLANIKNVPYRTGRIRKFSEYNESEEKTTKSRFGDSKSDSYSSSYSLDNNSFTYKDCFSSLSKLS